MIIDYTKINELIWLHGNDVCGRGIDNVWQFQINAVNSQSKVYKQALHSFFDKFMPLIPQYGEFEMDIKIYLNPEYPQIDVDNVAKAVCDGIKKHVFIDDSQIMRLLVEKIPSETEKIFIEARKR